MIQFIVISLAALFLSAHGMPNYEGGCTAFGFHAKEGDIFSVPGRPPCLKYRCYKAVAHVYQEACELGGQCYDAGTTFVKNCVTYNCTKVKLNDAVVFKTTLIKTECQDANGVCRKPGEIFKRVAHGVLFSQCTCVVSQNLSVVDYNCNHK